MEKKGKRTTVDAPRSLLASELIAKSEENRASDFSCVCVWERDFGFELINWSIGISDDNLIRTSHQHAQQISQCQNDLMMSYRLCRLR